MLRAKASHSTRMDSVLARIKSARRIHSLFCRSDYNLLRENRAIAAPLMRPCVNQRTQVDRKPNLSHLTYFPRKAIARRARGRRTRGVIKGFKNRFG